MSLIARDGIYKGSTLDKAAILQKISENAPDTAFIFTARNEDEPPMLLEQGAVLYFVELGK